jgi:hypothetical protein
MEIDLWLIHQEKLLIFESFGEFPGDIRALAYFPVCFRMIGH